MTLVGERGAAQTLIRPPRHDVGALRLPTPRFTCLLRSSVAVERTCLGVMHGRASRASSSSGAPRESRCSDAPRLSTLDGARDAAFRAAWHRRFCSQLFIGNATPFCTWARASRCTPGGAGASSTCRRWSPSLLCSSRYSFASSGTAWSVFSSPPKWAAWPLWCWWSWPRTRRWSCLARALGRTRSAPLVPQLPAPTNSGRRTTSLRRPSGWRPRCRRASCSSPSFSATPPFLLSPLQWQHATCPSRPPLASRFSPRHVVRSVLRC